MTKIGAKNFCTTPLKKGTGIVLVQAVGQYKAGDTGVIHDTQGTLPKDMSDRPDWNYYVMMHKTSKVENIQQRCMDIGDRKSQVKACLNQIATHEQDIAKLRDRIDFLEHYEDQADFIAHKIKKLLDDGEDIKAIREVLKELGI